MRNTGTLSDSDEARRFAAIYRQTRAQVYAYAVTKVGRQFAEEVVSEVFLTAWRRLADLPDPPLPWLLTVTRNVSANQVRSAVRERALAAEMRAWICVAGRPEHDVADQVINCMTMLRALATLPEADRDVLTLRAWHGLSASEAARVLGCSAASYFVKLHRARNRLERAMAAAQLGSEPAQAGRTFPRAPADPAGPSTGPQPRGRATSGTQGFEDGP